MKASYQHGMRKVEFCPVALAITLIILLSVSKVQAEDTVEAVAGLTPTIDGTISVGEWNDATAGPLFTGPSRTGDFFVKQDGMNLYIGFNLTDATYSDEQDGIAVAIDVNNEKSISLQSDDIALLAHRNGTLTEFYGYLEPTIPQGWIAFVHSTSTYYQVEFNITYQKIDIFVGIGKMLGFALEWADSGSRAGQWPESYFYENPSSWGNLTSTVNWIPEFPLSLIILPLFMTTTLLASLMYRRKKFM